MKKLETELRKAGRVAGQSRSEQTNAIIKVLLDNGFSEEQVEKALRLRLGGLL